MPLTAPPNPPREARGKGGGARSQEEKARPGPGRGGLARPRACPGSGSPRPPHPSPRRCGAPCVGRGPGGCGAAGLRAARLPCSPALGGQARRAGGARSPLPLPALRGTALRARERRAWRRRPAQAPQKLSAGGSAILLRMQWQRRAFVSCVAGLPGRLITCGRRRELSKNRDRSQLRSLGRVSGDPRFTAYRERSSLLNGDTRLFVQIPEFGAILVEIFAKGLRGCRCLLPLFKLSVHCVFTNKCYRPVRKKLVELLCLLCKGICWATI